jgi:sugar phosphate isomerase/epimerase
MFAVRGVELGVHTFSFHQIHAGGLSAIDEIIASVKQLGLNCVELFEPQVRPFPMPEAYYKRWWVAMHPRDATTAKEVPPLPPESRQAQREALRQWRLHSAAGYFEEIKKRFKTSQIEVFAYNISFEESMTDGEVDAAFEQAKAIGAKVITSSSTLSQAERVVPFAERHRMIVAFHNTTSADPDRLVTPEALSHLLGLSQWYRINLDVAHLFAAGYDPVSTIRQQRSRIASLHLHDRKAHNGASVPNGEGETPLREILLLLRDQHLRIPSFYELEHVGSGEPIQEIERDLQYIQSILQGQ